MTVKEVVLTNGGSSFLGNDGGVWNFIASDGTKEFRSYHHSIVKVGDKICVHDFSLFGEEDSTEWNLSQCRSEAGK